MKRLIILFIILLPKIICAQRKDFKIEGTFSSGKTAGKVYYNYNERGINISDSTNVVDGKFELTGKLSGIQRAYVTFTPTESAHTKQAWRDSRYIYLEPGTIKVIAEDSLQHSIIKGSPINAEHEKFIAFTAPADRERRILREEYIKISAADRKVLPRAAELKSKIDGTDVKREELLSQYVRSHPDSYFSIEAIIELMGPYVKVEKVNDLWANIDQRLKDSYNGQIVNAAILGSKATEVGSRAPSFSQPDTSGKMVQLSDIKGKYVFVDFWASWCHPCRAENPNVLKAYNTYSAKNFTVLGISIDFEKDKDKWIKAIHEDGMPWTQLLSPANIDGGAMKTYGIRAIPSNFLVDPNGIIVAKNLHGPELQKKLAEIFE